jgi:hypothetical protein
MVGYASFFKATLRFLRLRFAFSPPYEIINYEMINVNIKIALSLLVNLNRLLLFGIQSIEVPVDVVSHAVA